MPPVPTHVPVVIEELLTARTSKWTVVVVLHLRRDTLRFSELLRAIEGISQKALTAALRGLERDGFISRTSYATIPPRVEYTLTDLGGEVLRLFEAWETFASRHWSDVLTARQRFDAEQDLGAPQFLHR